MNPPRLHRNGQEIDSVEAWFRLAPPAGGARHWKPGRSALELARAWCPTGQPAAPPPELRALWAGRPEFPGLSLTEACPEQRIDIDDYPGEPRNADLALRGEDARGPVALTVEAKADETFGDTVESTLRAVARRVARGERSNGAARVESLVAALLPPRTDDEPPTGELRYQLLTGVAGTLAWAAQHGAARAIFVVHELISLADTDERHRIRNRHDLDLFLRCLTGGAVRQLARGELVGPFRVPGNVHLPGDIDLYLGKIRRELD